MVEHGIAKKCVYTFSEKSGPNHVSRHDFSGSKFSCLKIRCGFSDLARAKITASRSVGAKNQPKMAKNDGKSIIFSREVNYRVEN